MKICVAPNSFKESLNAVEAAQCIAAGLGRALPGCEIASVPMADGGGGTVLAMVAATAGRTVRCKASGPLGEPVDAEFGILGGGESAVIEMAAASGLQLVPPEKRNPLFTTTFGTGELMAAALDAGVRRILIGIGGSATVDGGVGMAQALGVRFLDAAGAEIPRGGAGLASLARIDRSGIDRRISSTRIDVACDVDSPLTGASGAAPVYGPQKGATPPMVEQLSRNLEHLASVIRRDLGIDVAGMPGGGAAGGLGAGLVAFLGAKLCGGAEMVIEHAGLEQKMQGCHLVITGEGRLDAQSLRGKAPVAVARLARRLGIPAIAIAGCIGRERSGLHDAGIDAFFSIIDCPMNLGDAITDARTLLMAAAEQAFRAFLAGRRSMTAFVLASASPERKTLLAKLGLPFEVIPADIDETLPDNMPAREAAVDIARRKAEAAAALALERGIRAIVIAADTIVAADFGAGEQVIGKPRDDAHAAEILRSLSGSTHSVVTGLCVLDMKTGVRVAGCADTRIRMRRMTDEQIGEYVASGESRGRSGAYGFQQQGDPYVEEINGSFSNVLGLPLELLRKFLNELGVRV